MSSRGPAVNMFSEPQNLQECLLSQSDHYKGNILGRQMGEATQARHQINCNTHEYLVISDVDLNY